MNRAYGPWNLKVPRNNWEKFSANDKQSDGLAGVGTCHWPANAESDYDYGNQRIVTSWADAYLSYPELDFTRKPVSRNTWSKGPDYHLDYMKWYFGHIPRAAGVNEDGRQNNWFKYIFDFQSYDEKGRPLPAAMELASGDVADPKATAHVLRVVYRSADPIDPSSLGDDLSVRGPSGRELHVKLVGGNEPGWRSYRVVRYEVAAPGGTWTKAPAGPYTVTLRPNRVRTGTGKMLPAKRLGTFRVARTKETAPSAAASKVDDPGLPQARLVQANDVTRAGTGDVTLVVAFHSEVGIHRDSIGLGSLRVVGPNGFHQFPEPVDIQPSKTDRGTVVSYCVKPPMGEWRDADRGTYTIEVKGFQVADIKGNCAPESVLGRFHILQSSSSR